MLTPYDIWVGSETLSVVNGIAVHLSFGKRPLLVLDLTDKHTLEAIHSRDPRLFSVLQHIARLCDELGGSDMLHVGLAFGWEYVSKGGAALLAEYREALTALLQSGLGSDSLRERIRRDLAEIADYRKTQKRARTERKVKKELTKTRRASFNARRDELLLALIERDGYVCAECDCQEDLTIDHIIPLSKGGSDELDNLRLLCRRHNSMKGDKE